MIELEMVVSGTSYGNRMVEVVLRKDKAVLRDGEVNIDAVPASIVWLNGQNDKLGEEINKAFSASPFARLTPHEWPGLWRSEKERRFGVLDSISDVERREACESAIREAAAAAKISL